MTFDEAIKQCEEAAEDRDRLCKRYDAASGYSRSHNEAIRTNEAKEHEKRSQDFRQLAGWLKELKTLKAEPCEDAISRKWVLDVVNNFVFDTETDRNRIIHIVRDTAPSVIPKEKKEPILDKIKAEIERRCCITVGREDDPAITLRDVFEIIDKYKTESEE